MDEYSCTMCECVWHAIRIHPEAIDKGLYAVFNVEWVFLSKK